MNLHCNGWWRRVKPIIACLFPASDRGLDGVVAEQKIAGILRVMRLEAHPDADVGRCREARQTRVEIAAAWDGLEGNGDRQPPVAAGRGVRFDDPGRQP